MYVHIITYIMSPAKLLSGSEPLTIYRMRIQEDPFPWGDLPRFEDLPSATSMARSRGFPRFHDTGGPSSPRSRPRFFQQNWAFFRIFFDQKSLVILATDGSLEAITPGFGLRTGSKQIAENRFPIWHGHGKWMRNYTHHRYVHWKLWMTMINVENHDLPWDGFTQFSDMWRKHLRHAKQKHQQSDLGMT